MITIPLYRYNGTKIRFLTLSAIKRAINTATKLVTKKVQYLLVYNTNLQSVCFCNKYDALIRS